MSGLRRRGEEGDSEAAQTEAQELARIEAGGIPTRAQARLRELGVDGSMFTSGLSVKEFALLAQLQARPLAQVMGASVVRPGWQYLPALTPGQTLYSGNPNVPTARGYALNNRLTEASMAQVRAYRWHSSVTCELDVLADAWNLARRRALDRLTEEACQVGADAVVGVEVRRGDHDLARGTIEYVVTGTAIRLPGGEAKGWPVLTDISAQDYWRLRCAGYEPTGLLASTTVVFASPPRATRMQRLRTTNQNQELEELSRAFHAARDTIRARLLGQVSDAHGTGAVGVQFEHSIRREKLALASSIATVGHRGWNRGRLGLPYYVSGHSDVERRGWMITMHAAGTAVRRAQAAGADPVKPSLRMRGT